MKNLLTAIISALVLSGCITYGETTQSQFASLTNQTCPQKPERLYVFFENEPVEFTYEKIGLIEVQGGRYASLEEVLNELKYKAVTNCANAIIHVKQSSTVRKTGTTFIDDDEELYGSSILTGLAVKVDTMLLESQYQGNLSTTNFFNQVEERKQRESKNTEAEVVGGIVGVVLGIIIVLLAGGA